MLSKKGRYTLLTVTLTTHFHNLTEWRTYDLFGSTKLGSGRDRRCATKLFSSTSLHPGVVMYKVEKRESRHRLLAAFPTMGSPQPLTRVNSMLKGWAGIADVQQDIWQETKGHHWAPWVAMTNLSAAPEHFPIIAAPNGAVRSAAPH